MVESSCPKHCFSWMISGSKFKVKRSFLRCSNVHMFLLVFKKVRIILDGKSSHWQMRYFSVSNEHGPKSMGIISMHVFSSQLKQFYPNFFHAKSPFSGGIGAPSASAHMA